MNILLLSPLKDYRDHPAAKEMPWLKMSLPFKEGIYEPLCRIGQVTPFDYVPLLIGERDPVTNRLPADTPDYVLWVAFRELFNFSPSTFQDIRAKGAKVIAWFFDDNIRFESYSRHWLPHVDYVLTDTPDCVAKYEALGKPSAFALPIPDIIPPPECVPQYDVSFAGDLRADRPDYLAALKREGLEVQLFGEAGHNFLSYNEMLRVFASSRINLNFARTYDGSMLGVKARVFEVCMAGGFLLTEFAPGLPDFFLPGQEVSTFGNADDLVGKVRYYLGHPRLRQTIAMAGAARARQYTAAEFLKRAFEKWRLA